MAIRWNDAKLHVDQRKFMVVLEPAASGPVRPGSGKKMPYVVDSMNDPDGTSFKCKKGKYAITMILDEGDLHIQSFLSKARCCSIL